MTDQMRDFLPMSKGPTRTISAKFKGTKVGSLKGTTHIRTTTKVDIMVRVGDEIEMVIGVPKMGIEIFHICHYKIVMLA